MFTIVALGAFCAGMTAYASETESETAEMLDYKELGFSVKDPTKWEDLKGSLTVYSLGSEAISHDPELYASMLIYIPEKAEDLENSEDMDAIAEEMTCPGMVFTIKGGREQLLDVLTELGMMDQIDDETLETGLIQVGEAQDYQFFVLNNPDEEYANSLDADYSEDYANLPDLVTKEFSQAEFYAPVDPNMDLIGQKLSFTTTDLDGNTVTSEELFKDNEITMVNLWGVWCHNCVDEMEELAAIHTRLQEKGCGVVGLEWEMDPGDEIYQEARDLMDEKGTNYPSVLMPEDNEALSTVTGLPTTFFVDREGTILTKPIVGAKVQEYEPTVETLLEGASIPETEMDESSAIYTYRVFVMDEEENPIEEAVVQFCDDTTCRLGETDEDGCAEFEMLEVKQYEVHIVEAPDGFSYDEEEVFLTEETASDLTIVLKKAE